MTGVFSENFAFNFSAFDHPELDPDWLGLFELAPEAAFSDGWVYTQGELRRFARARKITRRDPRTLVPLSHEISFLY